MAEKLDFRIVVDDRRDLADPIVFDDAVQLTFGDIPETIHELEPDESSWIVIVTGGHHLDKDALVCLLLLSLINDENFFILVKCTTEKIKKCSYSVRSMK